MIFCKLYRFFNIYLLVNDFSAAIQRYTAHDLLRWPDCPLWGLSSAACHIDSYYWMWPIRLYRHPYILFDGVCCSLETDLEWKCSLVVMVYLNTQSKSVVFNNTDGHGCVFSVSFLNVVFYRSQFISKVRLFFLKWI